MKGDFTRFTFDPKKHYSSVRMQQGRIQLDSDWNEQAEIQLYHSRITNDDVIGLCGAPKHNPGFAMGISSGDLTIGRGRYYVQGILCENELDVSYSNQPDLRPEKAESDGRYLAYIEAWQRHLTAVEDGDIKEVALGGTDTATRTKTVWQVKLWKVDKPSENPDNDCPCLPTARSAGLAARTGPAGPEDPCILQQGAGYHGLGNQLYRVEIHSPGKTGAATFKWSRDNGSIVCAVEKVESNRITLKEPVQGGQDAFSPGKIIELSDEGHELGAVSGVLATVQSVSRNVLIFAEGSGIDGKDFPANGKAKVRLWDHQLKNGASSNYDLKTGTDWIYLEKGIQVRFDPNGDYRCGDYWLIPARRSTGQIEWPQGENEFVPRQGIIRYRCPIAVLQRLGGSWSLLKDCRRIFPPLTEIEAEGGGGSCSVTVGEGGEYEELAEAIKDLLKKNSNNELKTICICLLPGVHKVSSLSVIKPTTTPQFNLHIHGCGSATRLVSTGQMSIIGLLSIDFANMQIETKDTNDAALHASGAIFIEGTESVSFRSCRIEGEGIPLLRIGPTSRHIVISNCHLLPTDVSERFALIIHEVTEDATLTHNWIRGKLSLGPAGVHVGPQEKLALKVGKGRSKKGSKGMASAALGEPITYIWPDLSRQEMGKARYLMRHGLLKLGGPASGTLRMLGNRLTRVLAGDTLVKEIRDLLVAEKLPAKTQRRSAKSAGQQEEINNWVFRQVLFSGNIIEEENVALENFNPGSNQIIGKSISMSSNWLMPARGDDAPGKKLLAWAMAESAFYAGNSGPEEVQICDISRTGSKAGNTIEIMECQPAAYHLAYRDSDGWAQISRWDNEWIRRIIRTEKWEVGADIIPAVLEAGPHFLMRGPAAEGKANFSLYRLKAGVDKEKKSTVEKEGIWSESWEFDKDYSITPMDIGGQLNLVSYRPSDGDVQLWRRNPKGGKDIIGYGWGPGYELMTFKVKTEPYFVAYNQGSGSAELYHWTSAGKREAVRSESWQKGCHLASFELEGKTYLLMYGPKGTFIEGKTGYNSRLYVWNDDLSRSDVLLFNRLEDSTVIPFRLGGVPHMMINKTGEAAFGIYFWKITPPSKVSMELLGMGTIPDNLKSNITIPFEMNKALYFVSYDPRSDSATAGYASLCKGLVVAGKIPTITITIVNSLLWQKESLVIPYEAGGISNFLVYSPLAGNVLLSRGKSENGVDSLENLWTNSWEAADALMPFDLAGKPHYLASKHGPPVIELSSWSLENGTHKLIWSTGWDTGYVLYPLRLSGVSLVLAYKPGDGKVELCRWDSGGGRERIWISTWPKGYESLLFFEVGGQRMFLGYRRSDGQAELCSWDPANGTYKAIWSDEWGQGYAPLSFELDGDSYLLAYRSGDGRVSLYRWLSDGSKEVIWQEEWGQGYSLISFTLPEEI
jgi:hypothetical protein